MGGALFKHRHLPAMFHIRKQNPGFCPNLSSSEVMAHPGRLRRNRQTGLVLVHKLIREGDVSHQGTSVSPADKGHYRSLTEQGWTDMLFGKMWPVYLIHWPQQTYMKGFLRAAGSKSSLSVWYPHHSQKTPSWPCPPTTTTTTHPLAAWTWFGKVEGD